MGGVYGDKPTTLARFKENYVNKLPDKIKKRLVLENDEVSARGDVGQTLIFRSATTLMTLCLYATSLRSQCKCTRHPNL
jgi:hypothetical protein